MKRKGYSLLEVMIVVALFSLLFGIVFSILATGKRSWDIGSTKQDLENQARQALEFMSRELYSSNSGRVTISQTSMPKDTITFQVPVGYKDNGDLKWGVYEVTTESTTSGPVIIVVIREDYKIRYIVNARQLLRQILDAGGTPKPNLERVLANNVNSLIFSLPLPPLSTKILTITLTTQKKTLSGESLSSTLSSKVTFRN